MPTGDNPKSRRNLQPFKPGHSGNPLGRPKKRPITDEYFQILNEPIPEVLRREINQRFFDPKFPQEFLPPGTTWARAGALRRAMDSLMEGGYQSSKEMREAMEGKAPLRLEIQGQEHRMITITVKHDRKRESSTLNIPPTSSILLNTKDDS